MKHTGLTARCDSCHGRLPYTGQGIYGALGTTAISNHIPTTITSGLDCTTCHTTFTAANINVVSGAADWKPEVMTHNGGQGMGIKGAGDFCVECHQTKRYLGNMDTKNHKSTSKTKDCSSSGCHKPVGSKGATYSKWD
jgi:hypothetical protein